MKKYELSIIVPTLNEAENLQELLSRIDATLKDKVAYEVIIVDDHSTDNTKTIAQSLAAYFPLRFFTKKGNRGKAYSLIEGFSYTDSPILAFIDADLQYPPEALLEMYVKIISGADVVVSERQFIEAPIIRKFTSRSFKKLFASVLHKLPYDVQSGLKVFKRKVIRRIELSPSRWSFDLEFLLKAKHAGYVITSAPIHFQKRKAGYAKVSVLTVAWELALSAIRLKFQDFGPIPFLHEDELEKGKGFHYKSVEYVHHTNLEHQKSAFTQLSLTQKFFLFFLAVIIITGFVIDWHATLVLFIALLTFVYFVDLLFNLFLIFRSFHRPTEIKIKKEAFENIPDEKWPTYTIFCPLYKEWRVVPQFVSAMGKLDYPKDKLQIMLLLEEDDVETIEKVRGFDLPSHYTVTVVPHSLPKTKPKALNYGMLHATGEYIVVYDAEDVPDPYQLKKAVLAFEQTPKRVVCIQAKLNFYNPHQNILTRVFTAEYSLWFDLVLTGLHSIKAPIPLGGTSNHFRREILHKLKGWDSFNVTEDCDLGMRLVKNGYQTAVIDSTTHEEANSDLSNWFNQRTRWIKGYIQSYLVHMRDPKQFFQNWKEPHAITFQLIVGGKILSMFINPVMWIITISYFVFRSQVGSFIESFYPAPILYMGLISLLIGNFLYMYYYMIGCYKRDHDEIIKYAVFVPFYWLAMSIAATRAMYQIVVNPHYWSKTKHGLHLDNKKTMKQAEKFLGDKKVVNKVAPTFAINDSEILVNKRNAEVI